jgi:hypothetical protein
MRQNTDKSVIVYNEIDEVTDFYGRGIVRDGLVLDLDAGITDSYPGSGTTWTDLSPYGNNGTLTNTPTYSGANGGSLSFNGSNQYAICSGTPLNVTSYTKSVWFKLTSTSAANNLVSCSPGHFMFFGSTTQLYCGHSDWGVYFAFPSTTIFSAGIWYNACLTFNTTDGMKLYINGSLDATYTANKTQAAGGGIEIGSFGAGNFLNGNIAQASVYNRTLSAAEILQNYNALRGRYGL